MTDTAHAPHAAPPPSCRDWREALRLAALRRQLAAADPSSEEARVLEAEIRRLTTELDLA